jgi:hypothetical protein
VTSPRTSYAMLTSASFAKQSIGPVGRKSSRSVMRVGISAGDATREDGDCFGTPIVEASRLRTAASGSQILVSDIIRVLADTRTGCELRPVSSIEAKGLLAQVPTNRERRYIGQVLRYFSVEVVGLPSNAASFGLLERGAITGASVRFSVRCSRTRASVRGATSDSQATTPGMKLHRTGDGGGSRHRRRACTRRR